MEVISEEILYSDDVCVQLRSPWFSYLDYMTSSLSVLIVISLLFLVTALLVVNTLISGSIVNACARSTANAAIVHTIGEYQCQLLKGAMHDIY